jgi:hypothetical protein
MSGNFVVPVNNLFIAQYYKSVNQNLTNGNTDITFDREQTWNNDGSFINLNIGTADFTVVQPGIYQLELNLTVNFNGSTWNVAQNKVISIDITRVGSAEVVAFGQANVVATGGNYIMSCSSTYYLQKGDIINCRHYGNFATATPNIAGAVGFDLNTWFTWKYI